MSTGSGGDRIQASWDQGPLRSQTSSASDSSSAASDQTTVSNSRDHEKGVLARRRAFEADQPYVFYHLITAKSPLTDPELEDLLTKANMQRLCRTSLFNAALNHHLTMVTSRQLAQDLLSYAVDYQYPELWKEQLLRLASKSKVVELLMWLKYDASLPDFTGRAIRFAHIERYPDTLVNYGLDVFDPKYGIYDYVIRYGTAELIQTYFSLPSILDRDREYGLNLLLDLERNQALGCILEAFPELAQYYVEHE
jgi:hypothetical protein